MSKVAKKNVLLLAIFAFAFIYRIFLLLRQTYPPGSDIGFQAGVISSITRSGNTNFLWNFYQMGGGIELEFSGYHIFASEVMILTGLPNFLAQAVVVAVFSALIVLAVFLVTRLVWNESAAFIVAFFVAISQTDIQILCWGGEPNIVALFLIPTIFYLFLKRDKIGRAPFLVSATFLAAAIFLVHSLSAAVFLGIVSVTILVVLAFPRTFNESRKSILRWVLPLFVGAVLISPFLATAVPAYLNQNVTILGTPAIEQALVVNRAVPIETSLALFVCVALFFLFSKVIKGRFFSLPVFLVIIWLLVPLVLTQDYSFGLYLDSIRFLYFLIYPVLILLAVLIDYSLMRVTKVISSYLVSNEENNKKTQFPNRLTSNIKANMKFKAIYGGILLIVLLVLTLNVPIFCYPWTGIRIQEFYQVMDKDGYQAIEWAKNNTPADSVFVSPMAYGWWLAGVGLRPTLTDVALQDITLAREVNISENVSYLLDTDYAIDNGYIQVREDGGYIARHNPIFLADLNSADSPYAFFQFNSSQIILLSHIGNSTQSTNVAELPVVDMKLDGGNGDSPSIIINKQNSLFSYTQITEVTKGSLFANMTIIVQGLTANSSMDWLNLIFDSQGTLQQPMNNTLAILDQSVNECGQLIFAQTQPTISSFNSQNPCITQLSYDLQGRSTVEIQILVGMFPVKASEIQNPSVLEKALTANLQNLPTVPALPITNFDYKSALQQYNVSYVVNLDSELNPKYADDPEFSLAFINPEVTIFKVEANATTIRG
jgi:hypothetical protein